MPSSSTRSKSARRTVVVPVGRVDELAREDGAHALDDRPPVVEIAFQRRQLAADDQARGAGDARDRAQLAQQVAVALEPGVAIARRQRAAPLPRRAGDDRRTIGKIVTCSPSRLAARATSASAASVGEKRVCSPMSCVVAVGLVERHDQRDVRGAERDDLRQQRAVREADVLGEQPERDAALPVGRRGAGRRRDERQRAGRA